MSYLMWCASWDKNGISKTLYECICLHIVLVQQSLLQYFVHIPALIMDWVMVRLNLFTTLLGHLIET